MQSRPDLAPPLLAALILFGSTAAGADQKPGGATVQTHERIPSFDEARAQAQQARRTLVLEFGARWCQPCKEFDKHVLSHPGVQQALAKVVFIHYDAEENPGRPAAQALKVIGYPTFLALGQDGRVIDRLEGYRGPRQFIEWLTRVSIDWESDESLQVRLSRDPTDAEALLVLGRRQAQRGQDAEAETTLSRAGVAAQGISASGGPAKPRNESLAASADWEVRIVRLRRLLRETPRNEMAEHLFAFPHGPTAEAAFRELTHRGPADALAVRALDRYVDIRIEGVSQGHSQAEVDGLNEAVYGCLRAEAYGPAERAARRLVAIDAQNPLYLDTLAEVMHLRGDHTQAMAFSTRAIAAVEHQGEAGRDLRAVLLKNQARFARAAHELPTELLGDEEELSPWERPIESHK
jgi:thiol-disulfide isomerase/thioredoxin